MTGWCAPAVVAVPAIMVPVVIAAAAGGLLGMLVGEFAGSDRVGRWLDRRWPAIAAGSAVATLVLVVLFVLLVGFTTGGVCIPVSTAARAAMTAAGIELAVCAGVGWCCGCVTGLAPEHRVPVAGPVIDVDASDDELSAVWSPADRRALEAIGVTLEADR